MSIDTKALAKFLKLVTHPVYTGTRVYTQTNGVVNDLFTVCTNPAAASTLFVVLCL